MGAALAAFVLTFGGQDAAPQWVAAFQAAGIASRLADARGILNVPDNGLVMNIRHTK